MKSQTLSNSDFQNRKILLGFPERKREKKVFFSFRNPFVFKPKIRRENALFQEKDKNKETMLLLFES